MTMTQAIMLCLAFWAVVGPFAYAYITGRI